jgi:hypothetical protein
LIQVPDQSINLFYDDGESINVQSISAAAGEPSRILTVRLPEDIMTFGIANFKDTTSIYLAWLNRKNNNLGRVVAEYPFDLPKVESYTSENAIPTSMPAPVSVAASQNSIAMAWIGGEPSLNNNYMMLSRTANAGQDFVEVQLKYLDPIWAAIAFVDQIEMYSKRTFIGVYQEEAGGTNFFKFDADDPEAAPAEEPVTLLESGETMIYLSIAAFNKKTNIVVTGQVQSFEGNVRGVMVAVLTPNGAVESMNVLEGFTKPSLYITPSDEIFLSYMTPDYSTCIEVYEDIDLKSRTMYWCSEKYPTAPSWSGLTADTVTGFMAMTVVRESKSVVDVYKCDFGCGNGVLSPIRDEQCDVGGINCNTNLCVCLAGTTPNPPSLNCIAPQGPQASSPPPNPPVASPTPPPTGTVLDVVPILDCNARVNQTHFRSYLSYDTRTTGVAFVTVPIGDKNKFTPIAPNQGQPTQFFAGRSTVYNTAVDISVGQPVNWLLTKYNLGIAEAETNRCPTEIMFEIGITSPNPPSESFINATIDYVAWVFNVSNNNVSINVTQGEQQNEFVLNVSVQVTIDGVIAAIEEVRNITEDTTSFEDHIKDINPDVSVTDVRGRPTGVDNPATFEAEPIAPESSANTMLVSVSVLAVSLVALL